jgi:AcrR family transcriptional regulator
MSSELPRSTREPRRRGKHGETRARLIQVAVELVRREGLQALTTIRITKAAGITQPGFYAHFKNVDDIVHCAVSEVIEDMRHKISEVRRSAFERLREARDLVNLEVTRAVFADTLALFLSDPRFAEIFLRYRRDPSLLGGYVREAAQRVREDVTLDLWRNAQATGFQRQHYPLVAFWAEQILALYFAAAEALLDGRYEDKELLMDSLARSSFAILQANRLAVGLGGGKRSTARLPASPRRGR